MKCLPLPVVILLLWKHIITDLVTGTRQNKDTNIKADDYDYDYDHSSNHCSMENDAYSEVSEYVRYELFPNPEVIPMTKVIERLIQAMNSWGITNVKESTKKHIKRKLEHDFKTACIL